MAEETPEERERRRSQRLLFDSIADLYDATRHGYPAEIVDFVVETAGLRADDPVLEVGCGTGQLTAHLATRGFALSAIDIGPSMVEVTRAKVGDFDVAVQAVPFEDYQSPPSELALVVSATAFHWIDPDIAWTKSAELLRPGGWIAILGTAERYDDPFGSAYREQWIKYSADGGRWAITSKPSVSELISATGLFEPPVTKRHIERRVLPREVVTGLEQTRATTLGYEDVTRSAFLRDLAVLLDASSHVGLTQETVLTMAAVRA